MATPTEMPFGGEQGKQTWLDTRNHASDGRTYGINWCIRL